MGVSANRWPEYQDLIIVGAIAGLVVWALAEGWNWNNNRRERQGKARLRLEPIHVIALGLFIAFAGACWQVFRPSVSPSLEGKVNDLVDAFDRYVKPRQLTEQQGDTITKFLLERKPPETVYVLHYYPDDEAASYAGQLQQALINADWKTSNYAGIPPNLPADRSIMRTGIYFFVEYTPAQHENSRALRLLEGAFREAGVQARGMGSWTNPEGAEQKLYLCVGPRPNL